ncbi:GNAT family N-acetyltransferase [Aureimonas sp. AU4]|uniref:GNAT family N-acetyltransferase n=1 Tax=Aureimonas sp. AU4 TaxID=1638163 RepID=UPI001FCDA9D9|nr:GNAT family N-acetyltransferase [Aureimonas sp. AU4]
MRSPSDSEEPSSPRLITRSLALRGLSLDDAPAIAALLQDRRIAEMTARIPHPYTLRDAETYISSPPDDWVRAVDRLEDGALVGIVSLRSLERRGQLEIGYWIGRPFWNRGYATQAAQTVIDHAFAGLEAEVVEARCRAVNAASRRVIAKCGFGYSGTGLSESLVAGRVSCERYRMDRRTWSALKSWGACA